MTITRTDFGTLPDGTAIDLLTLENSSKNLVQLTNFGAILVAVEVPDRNGRRANVNLGFPMLEGYLQGHPYFGSTVGRYCNRIAHGRFELDGQRYELAVNNGPNHLHGGLVGFDKLVWSVETYSTEFEDVVQFRMTSPDGQEGYPGTLQVLAETSWSDANELKTRFLATTDQATHVNLTNHAYWNLAGANSGHVRGHELQLQCDRYLEVDEHLIPTGRQLDVDGSPLDFRQPQALGARLDELPNTLGYDHCFVVNGQPGSLRLAAKATDPSSGRVMELFTTQPGCQLYTGNHLSGSHPQHSGFCLETQHFPDTPNRPEFPSTRLEPGQLLDQTTLHRFSVQS